ncbi:MAG: ankyrin repeat domain-containing protein [Acidobacteriota bacterium]
MHDAVPEVMESRWLNKPSPQSIFIPVNMKLISVVAISLALAVSEFAYSQKGMESNQRTDSSNPASGEWRLERLSGHHYSVALNSTTRSSYIESRHIFVYLEERDFRPDTLKDICNAMAVVYKKPQSLSITIYSDKEMLQRAINVYKAPVCLFDDGTPAGKEALKQFTEKVFPSKTGYYRAYFIRSEHKVDLTYSPYPDKVGTVPVYTERDAIAEQSDDEITRELVSAIEAGEIKKALSCINLGANIRNKGPKGITLLQRAAVRDQLDVIKSLLDHGTDVEEQDDTGGTALMDAAFHAGPEVVQVLLDKGADINAKSNDGCTPLRYAALQGRSNIVEMLLDHGARLEARDEDGWTALMTAIDYPSTVQLLLDRGADVNVRNNAGYTVLNARSPRWSGRDREALVAQWC